MILDSSAVIAWLAEYSVRVAALILVVGAGSLLARRASAHGRLFAWTVVLHLAVAMPVLMMVMPEVALPQLAVPAIVLPASAGDVASPAAVLPTVSSAAPRVSWTSMLVFVYFAGVGVFVLRLLHGWRMATRVVRGGTIVTGLDVPASVRVVESADVHVPFASGVFRPTVVLPASWRSWDPVMRTAVLAHELSHIVRRDLWALRLAAVYRAATWINPLSWWLRRRVEVLAERSSDEAVLAAGVEPTAYAEVLVGFFKVAQQSQGRASWQLAMARRGDADARKRVGRVLNAREGGSVRFGKGGRMLVGVGVVLAAVPAIMFAASAPEAVLIQQPQAKVAPQMEAGSLDPAVTAELKPRPPQGTAQKPVKTVDIALNGEKPKTVDIKLTTVDVQQPVQQDQEVEPWRSTKRATDPDVVAPRLSTSVHPKYTPDAMRAKIQGIVEVEVIVSASGIVSNARVIKSLDTQFGLDGEALTAATQWTFFPGTYKGEPTAVRAHIMLEFRLH